MAQRCRERAPSTTSRADGGRAASCGETEFMNKLTDGAHKITNCAGQLFRLVNWYEVSALRYHRQLCLWNTRENLAPVLLEWILSVLLSCSPAITNVGTVMSFTCAEMSS